MQRRGKTVKVKYEWKNKAGHSTGNSYEEYVSLKQALESIKRFTKLELDRDELVKGAIFNNELPHGDVKLFIEYVGK